MSRSLINCKHIPGWCKAFITEVAHGRNDVNAAGRAGVSTRDVIARIEKDPAFKEQYDHAVAQAQRRKERVSGQRIG